MGGRGHADPAVCHPLHWEVGGIQFKQYLLKHPTRWKRAHSFVHANRYCNVTHRKITNTKVNNTPHRTAPQHMTRRKHTIIMARCCTFCKRCPGLNPAAVCPRSEQPRPIHKAENPEAFGGLVRDLPVSVAIGVQMEIGVVLRSLTRGFSTRGLLCEPAVPSDPWLQGSPRIWWPPRGFKRALLQPRTNISEGSEIQLMLVILLLLVYVIIMITMTIVLLLLVLILLLLLLLLLLFPILDHSCVYGCATL